MILDRVGVRHRLHVTWPCVILPISLHDHMSGTRNKFLGVETLMDSIILAVVRRHWTRTRFQGISRPILKRAPNDILPVFYIMIYRMHADL